MVIFFGGGVIIFILLFLYLIVTASSQEIIDFLTRNLTTIISISVLISLIFIIAIFFLQKKTYKKFSWLTPFISLPSLIQFFYFGINGILGLAKTNIVFAFFGVLGYIFWLILSGIATVAAQILCVGLPEISNKYTESSFKVLTLLFPIGVGVVGMLINSMFFS